MKKQYYKENKYEMAKSGRDIHFRLPTGLNDLADKAMAKLNQGFLGVTKPNFIRMAIKIYSEEVLSGRVKIELTINDEDGNNKPQSLNTD